MIITSYHPLYKWSALVTIIACTKLEKLLNCEIILLL